MTTDDRTKDNEPIVLDRGVYCTRAQYDARPKCPDCGKHYLGVSLVAPYLWREPGGIYLCGCKGRHNRFAGPMPFPFIDNRWKYFIPDGWKLQK